jgi:hypothetical protein
MEDTTKRFKIEEKILDTHQDMEDNKFISFVTQRKAADHHHEA